MDAVSAGIIVGVLSVGTLLVYVYMADYQKRQQRSEKQPKQGVTPVKSSNNKIHPTKVSNSPTKKQITCEQATQQIKHIKVLTPISSDTAGLVEPSQDELDSSIPVKVFDPTTDEGSSDSLHAAIAKTEKKASPRQNGSEKGNKNHKQKIPMSTHNESSYEQLFTLIDACNLSKDEIELAVESLLNKSSNPDWKPPKSDPLNKVRNQLEQTKSELTKQHMVIQNRDKQLQKAELNNKLLTGKIRDLETNLKNENEEKMNLLRGYELTSKKIGSQIHDFEEKLQKAENEANTLRSALTDVSSRMKEVLETNSMLEKSLNELQLINGRQEEMLMRLREERHVNEASMKRTLCEMEKELRELQEKLSVNSAKQNERLRREFDSAERESRLILEMKELREGLSSLLPDIRTDDAQMENDNWVHRYLGAVRHLAKTVEELKETNNNTITNNNHIICSDSPSKQFVDKSTLTPIHKNGATSRVNSPTSNGRASKAGSHKMNYDTNDKKAMETKLIELHSYVAELEGQVKNLGTHEESVEDLLRQRDKYEEKVKELALTKNKLEAQVKFGLDSLKMEQQRSRGLEEELSRLTSTVELH